LVAEDANLADEDALDALTELRLPEPHHAFTPEEGDVQEAGAVGEDHLETIAADLVANTLCAGGGLHVCHSLYPGHHRDIVTGLQTAQVSGLGTGQVTAG